MCPVCFFVENASTSKLCEICTAPNPGKIHELLIHARETQPTFPIQNSLDDTCVKRELDFNSSRTHEIELRFGRLHTPEEVIFLLVCGCVRLLNHFGAPPNLPIYFLAAPAGVTREEGKHQQELYCFCIFLVFFAALPW